jgi:ABC-type dipeptide/oligopeptide/nickel transport system ATPase subunit
LSLNDVSETEHFVARQEELADIHKALGHKDSRRTVVLQGLGGIGKTQLAVMYAKLHKTDYTAVFWLNIKDENSLKHSFAKIARRIFQEPLSTNRPGTATKESNLDEVVDIVKLWLDQPRNSQWLIVFDNYDNPKVAGSTDEAAIDIHRFLPEVDHGSIIITKRSSKVNIGHRIQVRKLKDIRDSLQILSNTSHRDSVIDGKLFLILL